MIVNLIMSVIRTVSILDAQKCVLLPLFLSLSLSQSLFLPLSLWYYRQEVLCQISPNTSIRAYHSHVPCVCQRRGTHGKAPSHRWSEFASCWSCKQIQYFISTAPSHASIIDTTWKSGNWFFLGTVCRNMQPVSPFLMGALTERLTITSNEPSPDVCSNSAPTLSSVPKMDLTRWIICGCIVITSWNWNSQRL